VTFTPAAGQEELHGVLFEIDGKGKCIRAESIAQV